MPTSALIHMIGTLTLVIVLTFVILHVNNTISIMRQENLKNNFMRIADSISVQILYALMKNNNLTIRLKYPVLAAYNQPYNIIIGTGSAIIENYKIYNVQNNSNIYVVVSSLDNTVHVEKEIIDVTSSALNITLVKDPILIGSTTISYMNITVLDQNVFIEISIKGVVYR